MKGEKARKPKFNILETVGIMSTVIGAIFLMMTLVATNPLALGAISLGLGIGASVIIAGDAVKENSMNESLLSTFAITTATIGLLSVIQGLGAQVGLAESSDVEVAKSLYQSAALIVGGLSLTGIGALLKDDM